MTMFPATSRATMQRLVRENLTGRARFTVAGTTPETGEVYNPFNGDFDNQPATPGTGAAAGGVVLRAEKIKSDPSRMVGMNISAAITLRVEGIDEQGNIFKPEPGMLVVWPAEDGVPYAVNSADAIDPQGVPILYVVIAGG